MLADDDRFDHESRQYLGMISSSAMRLAALATDTLALSRLEQNELALTLGNVDLAALVRDVVRVFSVTRPIDLRVSGAGLTVHGDEARLRQVVENVIGNAIKYSPGGEPVEVAIRSRQGGVELSVRDRGIGIPEGERGKLFGRFARASNARALGIGGTGFGLYLTKSIVELHGGTIDVKSVEGQGSTFRVFVPVPPCSAPSRRAASRCSTSMVTRGPTWRTRCATTATPSPSRRQVRSCYARSARRGSTSRWSTPTASECRPNASSSRANGTPLVRMGLRMPAVIDGWNAVLTKPFLMKDLYGAVDEALESANGSRSGGVVPVGSCRAADPAARLEVPGVQNTRRQNSRGDRLETIDIIGGVPVGQAARTVPTAGAEGRRKKRRREGRGRPVDPVALEEVRALLGDEPRRRDLLIEHLHKIQDRHHAISAAHLNALAEEMRLAPAEVFEVATFYHHFDVVKEGDIAPPAVTVRVCDGLSCEMAGAQSLLALLRKGGYGDGVRVITAPCVGRCETAPVAVVNQNAIDHATVAGVDAALEGQGVDRARPRVHGSRRERRRRRLRVAAGVREGRAQRRRGDRDAGELIAARPGRRRLSRPGAEVEDRARRARAAPDGGQHRRRRARHVQGPLLPRARSAPLPRRHAHRRVGGRDRRDLRLPARRVRGGAPHPHRRDRGAPSPAARCRSRRSTCAAAPEPTSAAKSRR